MTTTHQCIECTHAKLARNGCGKCTVSKRTGWYPSPTWPRVCRSFERTEQVIVTHRRAQMAAIGSIRGRA